MELQQTCTYELQRGYGISQEMINKSWVQSTVMTDRKEILDPSLLRSESNSSSFQLILKRLNIIAVASKIIELCGARRDFSIDPRPKVMLHTE